MKKQYVTKPYRQRTSIVTSVPIEVRVRLELLHGDHLIWQVDNSSKFVQISKVVPGGNSHGIGSRSSDRKDSGG